MSVDIETIVIGAGVVGLAVARALSARGQSVMVLERHDAIGTETSARNSEVIHAGLYYPQGSLRARLCVAGKHMLYAFAEENGITVSRCGKLVAAGNDSEQKRLGEIAERARANGVDDLAYLDAADAKAREPELSCVAALLSPSTGVIDSHGYMLALEGHITAANGEIILSSTVDSITLDQNGNFTVKATSAGEPVELTTHNLVNSAGLDASRVGNMLPAVSSYNIPTTRPAKGHYYTLTGRAPFSHLIYPIPADGGLGVHLTLDIAGAAKFGPDITWTDKIDYQFEDEGGARKERFENAIRRYWPNLPTDALAPGYTGIRPKIYARGEPPADFAIHTTADHGIERFVGLYGIESPGLTAALAIGEHVADQLQDA